MTFSLRLHLGVHKTASTHIQANLRRNRPWLERNGALYFGPRDVRGRDEEVEQAFGLPERAGGATLVLLSEENALGTRLPLDRRNLLYDEAPGRISALVDHVGERPIELFISVRDMAPWMASVYRQQLTGGRIMRFERFARGFVPADLRWSRLIARFRAIPGVQSVTVWPFEAYRDNQHTVFEALLGPDLMQGFEIHPDTVFPSITAEGVEAFLAWDRKGDLKAKAREVREVYALENGYTPFKPWPPEVLAASKAAYQEDLARISEMDGVTFLNLPLP